MSESFFINYDNIYPVYSVVNNWSMYNQYFIDIIINVNDDLSKILNNI